MAQVTVYLPDDLREQAKAAGLNISGLAQEAIRRQLVAQGHYDLEVLLEQSLENVHEALRILREQT